MCVPFQQWIWLFVRGTFPNFPATAVAKTETLIFVFFFTIFTQQKQTINSPFSIFLWENRASEVRERERKQEGDLRVVISRAHTFYRFSITEEGREPLVVYIKVSSRKYVNQTSMPGYVIFTVFPIHYLSYTSGFWEAILKIDIYIFGCLKVSLQVKEVLEVVKLIQTTALLITLFIHYFIISAVREISKSSYLARYSGNYC